MFTRKIVFKTLGALIAVAVLLALLPGAVLADDPPTSVTVCATNCDYKSIQEGINAVAEGGTVHVAKGTYTEDITVTGKHFNLIGEVFESGHNKGKLRTNLTGSLLIENTTAPTTIKNIIFDPTENHLLTLQGFNGGLIENCEFYGDGNIMGSRINGIEIKSGSSDITVENSIFDYGLYVSINGYVNGLTVKDSTFTKVKSGINLISGGNLLVENTDISVVAQGVDNDTYAIRFGSASRTAENMTVFGGKFNVNPNGWTPSPGTYHSAIVLRAAATGDLKINQAIIGGEVVNLSSYELDATKNYWGDPCGQNIPDLISGNVVYKPWSVDEGMTGTMGVDSPISGEYTFDPVMSSAEINAIIACAVEPGTTLIFDGEYEASVFVPQDKHHLTFLLKDGTVIRGIQEEGYTFQVKADYITIMGESYGGAKLVPVGRANGLDFWGYGLVNFILDGVEMDGSEQSESDFAAIYLVEGSQDIQILNNYIHDFETALRIENPGVGGTFDIQGNMFKDAGPIEADGAYDARYNSWGTYTVTAEQAIAPYDPQSVPKTLFNPWTHAEILLKSTNPTEDKLENHVFVDETITYEVYGVFREVFGADFTLTYDPAAYDSVTITDVTTDFTPAIGDLVTHTSGQIRFDGYGKGYVPFTSEDADGTPLYTVTFKPKVAAKTTTTIGIDPETDKFAMSPPWAYSTNIYGILPEDVVITVIDHPIITSDNITDYFLVGVEQQFEVSLTNPDTGAAYEHVMFKITVPDAVAADITSIQYEETPDSGNWLNLPYEYVDGGLVGWYGGVTYGGFPLTLPKAAEAGKLKVEFANAGDYEVNLELYTVTGDVVGDLNYTDETIRLIAKETYTMNVYDPPVLTPDVPAEFMSGVETDFSFNLKNPETGITTDVYAMITLTGVKPEDIESLTYYEDVTGKYEVLPYTYDDVNKTITIWYGPATGFPISPGYNGDALFKVIFNTDAHLNIAYTVELYDYSTDPDRLLASVSGGTVVFANYTVTGTVSMQGRTFRGEVPIRLVGQTHGKTYEVTSIDHISNNYTISGVVADTYLFYTEQERYLNVNQELGKTVVIDKDHRSLPSLGLRGGNAIWDSIDPEISGPHQSNNQIDVYDASYISTHYGKTVVSGTEDHKDADVNYDGKINIYDLALVGGNYDLTSIDAYAGWPQ